MDIHTITGVKVTLIVEKDGEQIINYQSHPEQPPPVKEYRNIGIQQGPSSLPPSRK